MLHVFIVSHVYIFSYEGTNQWERRTFPGSLERLGHAGVAAPVSGRQEVGESRRQEMILFGGVNPTEDLVHVVAITPPCTQTQ
jgi:hypothetical protein